ncbi:MAG: flavin reductase family protein [Desulfofustis sp. PB-SRB1]|jgi:flavin reductase (DIM6/NTAB) family NADH-FMN oxidoreductase RutF|nr:flavin reductase family protein [Desulfofustis sp. PB-SRB1]
MKRVKRGAFNALYPSLTTIVGCEVNGTPNWITIAHVGTLNHASGDIAGYLSIGLHRSHYSNIGIREHREFSINVPSQGMLEITDYAGLVSGSTVSKADLFEIERGELEHAPMIASCPVSMELTLYDTVLLGHHEIFIGEIIATYVDESCLTENKPDLATIDPILFDMMKMDYWSLGERTGKPWRDGKKLKNRQD